jgi:hemolysin D
MTGLRFAIPGGGIAQANGEGTTRYSYAGHHMQSILQDAVTREKPADKSDTQHHTGDESDTSEPAGQELVYSARVSLGQTQMQIDDNLVNLTPGMAVTVEIKTGSRQVIDYLLSPILRHKQQSLRERQGNCGIRPEAAPQ